MSVLSTPWFIYCFHSPQRHQFSMATKGNIPERPEPQNPTTEEAKDSGKVGKIPKPDTSTVHGLLRAAALQASKKNDRQSVLQNAYTFTPMDLGVCHQDDHQMSDSDHSGSDPGPDDGSEDEGTTHDDLGMDLGGGSRPGSPLVLPSTSSTPPQLSISNIQQLAHHQGPIAELLAKFLAQQTEGVAPAITKDIAELVNAQWTTNQKELSVVYDRYPRPENLELYKVDVNDEVVQTMNKFHKVKDLKLRSVQGAVVCATTLSAKFLDALYTLEAGSEDEIKQTLLNMVTWGQDQVRLLSHANMCINNARREAIKPALNSKYHALCRDTATYKSNLLFGANLAEKLKVLSQAVRIGKYPTAGAGNRSYRRSHPYKGQGTNKGNFLGRPSTHSKNQTYVPANNCTVTQSVKCIDVSYAQPSQSNNTHVIFDASRRAQQQQQLETQQGQAEPGLAERQVQEPELQLNQQDAAGVTDPSGVGILPIININYWPDYQAGRVSQCLTRWRDITSD